MATKELWKPGMKLQHRAQPGWGIGEVKALREEGRFVIAEFPGRQAGEPIVVSSRDPALTRARFPIGSTVLLRGTGEKGRVTTAANEKAKTFFTYDVDVGGEIELMDERDLLALAPEPGPLAALRSGQWDRTDHYALRQEAVTLDLQRRGDALGALFASRVMVKPYQVAVVQRLLSARTPRFLLADEVGLGKTIEAGMVMSALRQTGLGKRMVVVVPSHLALQWLAELYRKFNLRFTLLDGERLEAERKQPGSPWLRHDRILTSIEALSRNEDALKDLSTPEGQPDLVVFDEAHHLLGPKAFAAATALAESSWGVLFLTATPLALDQDEYFRLLQLLEPSAARDPADFKERMARQAEVARASRALLGEKPEAKERLAALVARFPADAALAEKVAAWTKKPSAARSEAVLEHLAEGYSLSHRLIRNRRAHVGGFPRRELVEHPVPLSKAETTFLQKATKALRAAVSAGEASGGAVGLSVLRRIESSPAAAAIALAGSKSEALQKLADDASALEGADTDARYRTFRDVLRGLPKGEKVLVFTEARDTLAMLATLLERDGIRTAQYHGDLAPLDRDRQVARFRDPEGPTVLLSSELGGEGRNFQFCRHLVHYDLPWSPSAVEQRIGRIDRVGQTRPMQIHVLRAPGTVGAEVIDLLREAVGVFEAPVGGLDVVLDGVEDKLAELAAAGDATAFAAYRAELATQVKDAQAAAAEDTDPLVDRRSYDRAALAGLVERGVKRLHLEDEWEPEDPTNPEALEEGLQLLSRALDERLEDVVVRLAQQAGIGTDTDEQVEAFECAFTLGREMNVEALPGIDIPDEPETILGSFWRDTAVEREELESFSSGHRMVEALIGLARDGHVGRSTFRQLKSRERLWGFQLRYLWALPEGEDVASGVRVPSRLAQRLLPRPAFDVVFAGTPGSVTMKQRDDWVERLTDPDLEFQPVRGGEVPLDRVAQALAEVGPLAEKAAQAALVADVAAARKRLADEQAQSEAKRALRRARMTEGPERDGLDREADEEARFYEAVAQALTHVRVELDSAAGFMAV
jgi:ATP-dependent helicase HepA